MLRPFRQVDVFTDEPYRGNPVAVVLEADGLETEALQRIANWTNLSETTFVLPPEDPAADYRVRIFMPSQELPFAGHPTLGTCHAWLEHGGLPHDDGVVVQECGVGLVRVRRSGDRYAFAAPPLVRSGPVGDADLDRAVAQLGIGRDEVLDAEWVDNGPGWLGLLLRDRDAVLALHPSTLDMDLGVVATTEGETALEIRGFFPKDGVSVEDPVTGSLNASLAGWLLRTGRVRAPYVAAQGTALGRAGRVHVEQDPDGTIWVGGGTVTCVVGELDA